MNKQAISVNQKSYSLKYKMTNQDDDLDKNVANGNR